MDIQQEQGSLPITGEAYDVSMDQTSVTNLDSSALILQLDKMFREAVDHPVHQRWLKQADLDHKFEEGEQWLPEEVAILNDRNQAAIVENEVKPVIEDIMGQYQKQRTTIKFVGKNTPVQEDLANGMSDLLRFVDQQTDLDFEETQQAHDGFVSGRGIMEIGIDTNELGEPMITQSFDDTFNYFPDPYSRRYDWNKDARYICRAKWMDLQQAQMRWPDKAEQLQMAANAWLPSSYPTQTLDPDILQRVRFLYWNNQRKQIRPVETWWKEWYRQSLYYHPDGTIEDITTTRYPGANAAAQRPQDIHSDMEAMTHNEMSADNQRIDEHKPGYDEKRIVTRNSWRMWVSVHVAGVLISHQLSPYDHGMFPYVPYFCFRKKDGEPYGYVRNLRDPQTEINHRRSRALYVLNNRQAIYEQGAIENPDELANELARADGQIVTQVGKFDKFMLKENTDIGQANLEMLQESKAAITRIAFGQKGSQAQPELRSGAAMARKQMEGAMVNVSALNNFRLTRRIRARLVFALIKQFFSGEMAFEITEDPNITRTVKIPASHFERIKEEIYDVVIEDATDYLTVRQEQQDMLLTNLPQWLKFGPGWAKIALSLSDLREKKGLLQQIDAMNAPAPPEPKFAISLDWSKLNEHEKANFAIKLGMQELAKLELQGGGQPSDTQTKVQADLVKTAMKTHANIEQAKHAVAAELVKMRLEQQHEAGQQDQQHMMDMNTQMADHTHEALLQGAQQDHEQTMQENEPAPTGGA